eukprot:TRINITY_DN763_c0_g1_i2.p1 TRINITY_DN763_c0_g1~~TRINITY_DN763_c0_g1_i2.p1  ORF type:complete len:291 (+),score=52.05 TRINITY_DN763_c0_g1_i2:86-958(+)
MSCGCVSKDAMPAPRSFPRVGQYVLGPTIGRGSTCKVKGAVHDTTGEEVAIKIQARRTACDQELRTMVYIVSRLDDKRNVVCMKEVMMSSRSMYMVLDRVNGGDLFELIKQRQRMDEGSAKKVLRDVVNGMRALQNIKVAHRDIKPENVLIDSASGAAKLTDFGLAKVHSGASAELSFSRCGTTTYAAPEILKGKPYDAYCSDVYSLGVTMFAALTGMLPQRGSDLPLHLPGDLAVSPAARDLVAQMTQCDPAARIPLAALLSHSWFEEKDEDGLSDHGSDSSLVTASSQ